MSIRIPLLKNKKLLMISIVLTLLIAGILTVVMHNRTNPSIEIPDGIAGSSEINYDPPTEEEKTTGDSQKDQNIKQQQLENRQVEAVTNATLVISDASYYSTEDVVEVRAYISNVIENGGTCKANFSQIGQPAVIESSQAFQDARTTQCGAINIARSRFPAAGTWDLLLTYSSPKASGELKSTIKI